MEKKPNKNICELFAGVGGFRLAFEKLSTGWDTVWFSQFEPSRKSQFAHNCYVHHFGDSKDLNGDYTTNNDICTVDKNTIPDHDLLVGGFPCQDYSVAQSLSTSRGIEGKKGVLWWQIVEVLEAKKPNFCIFENVDRLISSPANQRGRDFGIILSCLNNLGYSVEWRVVNSADYGAAQRRRRTFIFAYRNHCMYGIKMEDVNPSDIIEHDGFMVKSFPLESVGEYSKIKLNNNIKKVSDTFEFKFHNAGYMHNGTIYTTKVTERTEAFIPLCDILERNVDEKYYLSESNIKKFEYLKGKKKIVRTSKDGHEYIFSEGDIPFPEKLNQPSRTMLTSEGSVNRSTHIVKDPETHRLRTLTPVEAERLNGFDDNWTNTGMTDSNRMYCMGNALVIPTVQRMGETLDNIIEEGDTIGEVEKESTAFLYDFQKEAVKNMANGKILNGGTGSGKSRTSLYYYFSKNGGSIDENGYKPMTKKQDLVIITTAAKRDKLEWNEELSHYLLSTDSKKNDINHNVNIIIDSWNNIKKYTEIKNVMFIFDEQHACGRGSWTKSFYKIARNNDWIILSATPGDTYEQFIPVFIANGFYRNRTEFIREHIVYSRFTKYPKVEKYLNTGRLNRLRREILVDMDFKKETIIHDEDIFVKYDIDKYKQTTKLRWDPYKNEPIEQISSLCYILRRIVNESEYRIAALLEILEDHPKVIIFYNFNDELNILLNLPYGKDVKVAQWNGTKHEPIPDTDKWIYLVQYNACEGWNCTKTDTMIFYSQTYSYKNLMQAKGRIDRMNTPFTDLYYYHLKSRSGIDLAISKTLREKRNFNEAKFVNKWLFA